MSLCRFTIPPLRHFTLLGQKNTQNMPRCYTVKVKSAYEPSGSPGRSLSRFLKHEATRNISALLPLDGMLVYQRVTPSIKLVIPIYTPGCSEALWESSVLPMNTTQCPWPGVEPGPLDSESNALTMRPPRLPYYTVEQSKNTNWRAATKWPHKRNWTLPCLRHLTLTL